MNLANLPNYQAHAGIAREAANSVTGEVKTLCARLAHVRTQNLAWKYAKDLRVEARKRIEAGATDTEVREWLETETARELMAQVKARNP